MRAVYILLSLTIVFLLVDISLYVYNLPAELKTVVGSTFSSFSGALLLALTTQTRNKSDNSNNNNTIITADGNKPSGESN